MLTGNQIGVLMALSSSGAIGYSFVIKKQGLQSSNANADASAKDGGHAYLKSPLWWSGLLLMVFGEFANFAAYMFTSPAVVTSLGAMSVLVTAVLASIILKERLLLYGKVGCALCIVGSVQVVVNAPPEQEFETLGEISRHFFESWFTVYAFAVLVMELYLIYVVAPRRGSHNVLIYVTICALAGSISVMGIKALGVAVKLMIGGQNILFEPVLYVSLLTFIVCVVTQMNFLNKALDRFNTALVTNVYYVCFTTMTIIATQILYQDFKLTDEYTSQHVISALSGFLTICLGVFILYKSNQYQEKQSSLVK